MRRRLWIDLETYSTVPINHGTHRYAEGAQVLLFAWAIDDGPVSVWDLAAGEMYPVHLPLLLALEDPSVEVWAHNSAFDRTVLRHAPPVRAARIAANDIPRWRDTMVRALCHGLPGGLGDLCDILGVPTDKAKDKAGRQLVLLFCKPRADGSRATAATHPAEWRRFVEYAALDIEAMRAVAARLPAWNYRGAELDLWHRDQRINDRGVAVDLELATAAVAAVEAQQKALARRTVELTGRDVQAATQRDALLAHVLCEYGVNLPDMQAATIERRAADPDLPPALRELLAIRLQACTSSTAKYAGLLRATSADGRLRGTLQYSGAARTRRWAGRLFQPQNLPRSPLKPAEVDAGIDAMKAGVADLVVDDVMQLASAAIRGCIVAPPGRRLVVADLANIEGRVAAWLAGEAWKLDAFRAYDAGDGPDLYRLAYARAFAIEADDVTKDQRQIGKVMELMLQYEGGVGAFLTGAATYGIDLADMADRAWPSIPDWARDEAAEFLAWTKKQKRGTYGLTDRVFVVCDALKRLWRAAHPGIATIWRVLGDAAVLATEAPGATFTVGPFKLRRDGGWLRILLPSGNYLCYPSPRAEDGKLTYAGTDQYTRKWSRLGTYGGKLFENACQSLARDVMAAAMPSIEADGFDIVLTVHDEVVTEAPDTDEYSAERLVGLLATNPTWAPDLPLAAAGYVAHRYRKD